MVELTGLVSNPAGRAAGQEATEVMTRLSRALGELPGPHQRLLEHRPTRTKRPYKTRKPGLRVRKLTPKQTENLIADYEAGALMIELAMNYRITRQTVGIILRRENVSLRKKGLSSEQVAQAIQLHSQGVSIKKIGEQLGVDAATVWRRLREHGDIRGHDRRLLR